MNKSGNGFFLEKHQNWEGKAHENVSNKISEKLSTAYQWAHLGMKNEQFQKYLISWYNLHIYKCDGNVYNVNL